MHEGDHRPHLEADEYEAIFDVVQHGGDRKDARDAVARVSLRKRNPKTINLVFNVTRQLLALGEGEIRQPNDAEADAIAVKAGYDIGSTRVREIARQYMLWRHPAADPVVSLAKQQALAQHQEDLLKLADSLRYNMRVPPPDEALFDVFAERQMFKEPLDGAIDAAQAIKLLAMPGPEVRHRGV